MFIFVIVLVAGAAAAVLGMFRRPLRRLSQSVRSGDRCYDF
jgi:hypothetical protein